MTKKVTLLFKDRTEATYWVYPHIYELWKFDKKTKKALSKCAIIKPEFLDVELMID